MWPSVNILVGPRGRGSTGKSVPGVWRGKEGSEYCVARGRTKRFLMRGVRRTITVGSTGKCGKHGKNVVAWWKETKLLDLEMLEPRMSWGKECLEDRRIS